MTAKSKLVIPKPAVHPLWPFPFNAERFFQGVTQEWNLWTDEGYHAGIDLACPDSTPVKAVAQAVLIAQGVLDDDGKVGPAGHWMLFRVNPNLYYGYEHLSNRLIPNGHVVQPGDVVAHSGHSGNVTGPHLHMTVANAPTLGSYSKTSQVESSTLNPRSYIVIPSPGI